MPEVFRAGLKARLRAICVAAGVALALSNSARCAGLGDAAGLDPRLNYQTIETEHFRITFPEEILEIGKRASLYFEQAHAALSPSLAWEPKTKVQVVLIDNTDSANGFTSPVLRIGIALFVTPPEIWFSTTYYEDWLKLVVIHEYAHYLNIDATSDFWSALRVLFGDVFLPNALWPSWMHEGLAVFYETKLTRSGRGRSPYYDMVLRAAVEANVLDTSSFMTLDRVNGSSPYYPGGETDYLFGYELMHELASLAGAPSLGEMSRRSSGRIPYFINGNLENISRKSWYELWSSFVDDARARAHSELGKIRSQPVTQISQITTDLYHTLGIATDGVRLVYTAESMNERSGLFVTELATGKTRRLGDKQGGASIAFIQEAGSSPSPWIITSSIETHPPYWNWYDLLAWNLDTGERRWLTENFRAKDPDVSHDGRSIVFVQSRKATTGLMIAKLERDEGGAPRIAESRELFFPFQFDRVSTPRFSFDDSQIFFTLHRNGSAQEDLVSISRDGRELKPLLSNGATNRYPTVSPQDGRIYFISDLTGVDNLYRLTPTGPELLSNVETGLSFPAFSPDGKRLYAGVFGYRGWNISEISLPSAQAPPLSIEEARVAPIAAPTASAEESRAIEATPEGSAPTAGAKSYSVFPSIWPRQWAPILTLGESSSQVGGLVTGFDAVDRHRYLLGISYDTSLKASDWVVSYVNRSWGPEVSVTANMQTPLAIFDGSNPLLYDRRRKLSTSASFPLRWTYDLLAPTLSFNTEQTTRYEPGASQLPDHVIQKTAPLASADALLLYSNEKSSRLSITGEEGRTSVLAIRNYFHEDRANQKLLLSDTEHFRVTEHSVLTPSIRASAAARRNFVELSENVLVEGRRLLQSETHPDLARFFCCDLPGNNLDHLAIRGYPGRSFYVQKAAIASLEYRFPIARIFRGWGTNPAFLEQFSGFGFYDDAIFPDREPGAIHLGAFGGGVTMETELFYAPFSISLQYHKGLQKAAGGAGEFFVVFGIAGLAL